MYRTKSICYRTGCLLHHLLVAYNRFCFNDYNTVQDVHTADTDNDFISQLVSKINDA
jgi:hypothetical protein